MLKELRESFISSLSSRHSTETAVPTVHSEKCEFVPGDQDGKECMNEENLSLTKLAYR